MDKKASLEFMSVIVGLAWHGRLLKDTRFIGPLELDANDLTKITAVKTFNNPINIFIINPNIILYRVFSLNIYEYPKYQQHQYYHNRLKNHRHIRVIQFLSYYQPKNLLKHCLNIMELHLF